MTAMPACFASSIRAEYTAGMVPLPRRPMPRASVRQFMEFAVYMPEQEPHVGQVLHSYSRSFSSVILPALNSPTASEMEEKLVLCAVYVARKHRAAADEHCRNVKARRRH